VPIPEDECRKNELLGRKCSDGRLINDQRINDQRINDRRINDQQIDDQQIDAEPTDEKFESHLKQFRPLAPQPLPAASRVHTPRRWFVFAAWAATAAAVVVIAVLAFHARSGRIAPPVENFAIADQLAKPQALTIRTANALLATAPSFKDAIDGIAFPPKPVPLPADKHSALAELSKEKTEL
jgi:hypothetical protein